nr:hypothetical protein [Sulfodiicoccus acidiphilus]
MKFFRAVKGGEVSTFLLDGTQVYFLKGDVVRALLDGPSRGEEAAIDVNSLLARGEWGAGR